MKAAAAPAPAPTASESRYVVGLDAAARYLHLSVRTMSDLVAERKIPVIRNRSRKLIFDRTDLDNYMLLCKS